MKELAVYWELRKSQLPNLITVVDARRSQIHLLSDLACAKKFVLVRLTVSVNLRMDRKVIYFNEIHFHRACAGIKYGVVTNSFYELRSVTVLTFP
jgi:hypothetical protein